MAGALHPLARPTTASEESLTGTSTNTHILMSELVLEPPSACSFRSQGPLCPAPRPGRAKGLGSGPASQVFLSVVDPQPQGRHWCVWSPSETPKALMPFKQLLLSQGHRSGRQDRGVEDADGERTAAPPPQPAQAASRRACQAWVLCSASAPLGREIGLNGPLCSAYQELARLSVGNCAQAQK